MKSITRKEFAELAGVTADRISQLAKEGVFAQTERGQYPYPAAVTAYFRHLREAASRAPASDGADRIKQARAREIELRIAQREREVIRLDEVIPAIDLLLGDVRSAHDGFPARFTRDLELRSRLEEGMNDILQQVADRCRQTASALQSGSAVAGADAQDKPGRVGGRKQDIPKKRGRPRKTQA